MSTLNISLPAAMREYIDAQALAGNYSASEYVRHLIREDQAQKKTSIDDFFTRNKEPLARILAASAKELDAGLGIEWDVEKFLASGRKRRAKAKRA